MVLAEDLFMFCAYHFLHMSRRKINEILNFTVQRILGGSFATLIWNKLDLL